MATNLHCISGASLQVRVGTSPSRSSAARHAVFFIRRREGRRSGGRGVGGIAWLPESRLAQTAKSQRGGGVRGPSHSQARHEDRGRVSMAFELAAVQREEGGQGEKRRCQSRHVPASPRLCVPTGLYADAPGILSTLLQPTVRHGSGRCFVFKPTGVTGVACAARGAKGFVHWGQRQLVSAEAGSRNAAFGLTL